VDGTEIIREQELPLTGLIEPGAGFRIGSPSFSFTTVQRDGSRWTSVDQEHRLQVESVLRRQGTAVVIEHRMENVGTEVSPPIDVIEPLHLVFRQPMENWRHIFASGGTSEDFYPPTAYTTHERSRMKAGHGSNRPPLIESHPMGRSSNQNLPLLISLASTAPESDGLFCGLEWSASWYMGWNGAGEGKSSLAVGVKVNGMRLDPGESLQLPAVHLGFFSGGPAAATNALRRYLYEHVCARYHGELMIPRANYSTWFGLDNRIDAERLRAEARRAAELGLEVFAIDASWFPGNFPEGVGNWNRIDESKFPEGLAPFAQYVAELGMGLGMWFEVERAVEGTWAVQEHPEWFVPVPQPAWGRGQYYHLNLAEPDAQDWVIETVGGWIERLGLRWSRWDYNIEPRPFWEAVDPTLKIQFKYMQGLYRVLDTLMSRYPDWMVEGCSSGGRRIDIGTMKRAHTFWFSDQTGDPFLCRYMQARANRFLPGHLLDSTVAVPLRVGDAGYDDTALLSRMLGKLAFDGDVASWSPELTKKMAAWAKMFKATRHLMVQDFYQLLPIPTTIASWDALQFASYDGAEAALFVYAGSQADQSSIRLKGLDAAKTYQVKRGPNGSEAIAATGAELMSIGITVDLAADGAGMWTISAY